MSKPFPVTKIECRGGPLDGMRVPLLNDENEWLVDGQYQTHRYVRCDHDHLHYVQDDENP